MAFLRKLSDEQVAEILERRSTGESYQKIAADYDVSASRIYELTHPEKQAEKAAKLKEKNAAKRAAKKAEETGGEEAEDLGDLDLTGVDEDDGAEVEAEDEAEDEDAE
jgi:Zn-dependent peptidase ImmA (M78 family)